jgi:hypothetical protein
LFLASSLTSTVTVTIGAGGTAVTRTNSAGGTVGNVGGNTTFGAYLTSPGGKAGTVAASNSGLAPAPNAGWGISGDVGLAYTAAVDGGGGGGGGYVSSGSVWTASNGGTSALAGAGGNGAVGNAASATGATGTAPGGGGGGAVCAVNASYTATSGAGGNGQVVVYSW